MDKVNADEFDRLIPRGSALLGTNARAGADRAKAMLGWEPEMEGLEEHIPQAVIDEAKALGMKGKDPTPLHSRLGDLRVTSADIVPGSGAMVVDLPRLLT